MKKLIVAAFLVAVGAYAWFSLPPLPPPDPDSGGHAGHGGEPGALADGVIVSVDKRASAVTISHGPLRNLGMPPMTMGFRVSDPALLENIKPGDRVRFHADAIGGTLTVSQIERPAGVR
jgi:Cu(I)/Ag(I) efflux system protein CusF